MQRESKLKNLKIAGILLFATVVLPFLGAWLPMGDRLLLREIPVLLCGLVCGASYGAAVGLLAPLLGFIVMGEPAFYPDVISMMVEYLLLGAVASPIFRIFSRNIVSLYLSLGAAMAAGRLGYAAAQYIMIELQHREFSLHAVLKTQVIHVWPGLLLQLIAVPLLTLAADRYDLLDDV